MTQREPDPPPKPTVELLPEMEVLYDHENRLRKLEGQPTLTFIDFFTERLERA